MTLAFIVIFICFGQMSLHRNTVCKATLSACQDNLFQNYELSNKPTEILNKLILFLSFFLTNKRNSANEMAKNESRSHLRLDAKALNHIVT
jgi:hypothetical protein